MSTFKCPHCGNNLSNKAANCPECGCTLVPEETQRPSVGRKIFKSVKWVVCLFIISALVAFIGFFLDDGGKTPQGPTKSDAELVQEFMDELMPIIENLQAALDPVNNLGEYSPEDTRAALENGRRTCDSALAALSSLSDEIPQTKNKEVHAHLAEVIDDSKQMISYYRESVNDLALCAFESRNIDDTNKYLASATAKLLEGNSHKQSAIDHLRKAKALVGLE